jgi:hypothetical protein
MVKFWRGRYRATKRSIAESRGLEAGNGLGERLLVNDNKPERGGPEPDVPASERQCGCKGECCCCPQPGGNASGVPSHEIDIYKVLADLFNSEETSFWTRNNIMVVVQGGLIAATAGVASNANDFFAMDGSSTGISYIFFVVLLALSVVGFFTALAWLFMVHRSVRIADTISSGLKDIENELRPQGSPLRQSLKAFNNFGDGLKNKSKSLANFLLLQEGCDKKPAFTNSWRLSTILAFVIWLFMLFWVVLFFTILDSAAFSDARNCTKKDGSCVQDGYPPQPPPPPPPPVCPLPECARLTFQQLPPIGPFCLAKHKREQCKKNTNSLPQPDPQQLVKLVEKIHDLNPVQLTLVGSADRVNLVPALKKKYGSNAGLARARAEWVLEQIKDIWRQQYPTDAQPAALAQAQILNVGPAQVDPDAVEEDDRMVYVYVLVQDVAIHAAKSGTGG